MMTKMLVNWVKVYTTKHTAFWLFTVLASKGQMLSIGGQTADKNTEKRWYRSLQGAAKKTPPPHKNFIIFRII